MKRLFIAIIVLCLPVLGFCLSDPDRSIAPLMGDCVHDDTVALQRNIDRNIVTSPPPVCYLVLSPLKIKEGQGLQFKSSSLIHSYADIGILIDNPIYSWDMKNVRMMLMKENSIAVKAISVQHGDIHRAQVYLMAPNQIGVLTTTKPDSAGGDDNTMHNEWRDIKVTMYPDSTNSTAYKLTSGNLSNSNTCWDTWTQMICHPTHKSQTCLHLQATDTVSIRQFGVYNSRVGATAILYDYTVNPVWPNGVVIWGSDIGSAKIKQAGNPFLYGAFNIIYGFGVGNESVKQNQSNLLYK